jgi:leader peptidase (prepilin peptidase)/N-methyltransferase
LAEYYWIFNFFLFGAIFGSFANVVIYRLPKNLSIITPRSHCYQCQKLIQWFDNIPILSWFILGGQCRGCGASFSIRYAVVEFLMGALFATLFWYHGWTWTLLEHLIFGFALLTACIIDLDHMILPDEITLSGIVIGLIGAGINPEREFLPALYGALMGGGFLWAIAAIYFALRKQEGMGGGDVKLLAWIGAVLGWKSIPIVILSSSLIGSLVGVALMLKAKGGLNTAIPYGPFLGLGALIYIFGGYSIADLYIGLFIQP